MAKRHQFAFVLATIFASMGASYRTTNFMVEAQTPQIAAQVGQWAEHYRKEKAIQWLGREMPPWPEPCPLRATVTQNGAGGATTFNFMGANIWQTMHIEGPLDRLLASVLPHEITHTVFAHYFRRPVPRWADEGGAVLSEDDLERGRHDLMVRQIINSHRAIPLSRLFTLTQYPSDVGSLYAEGYSVADFLVDSSSRKTFLEFVGYGMQKNDWDYAAQTCYRFANVNQLEHAWIDSLRKPKRQQQPSLIAKNNIITPADTANRIVVRLTAPPVQPLQDDRAPIFRAQAPEVEQGGAWSDIPRQQAARPGYLPEYNQAPESFSHTNPSDQPAPPYDPWRPGVRLGAPQFDSQSTAPVESVSAGPSPVGYPYR